MLPDADAGRAETLFWSWTEFGREVVLVVDRSVEDPRRDAGCLELDDAPVCPGLLGGSGVLNDEGGPLGTLEVLVEEARSSFVCDEGGLAWDVRLVDGAR